MRNEINTTTQRKADAELVRLAQEGNEEAFATIFNGHRNKVYSLCLRMTANTAKAEDLTQDAFLQVFRKLGTFRGDSALSTWLYRVAFNTVLMHLRKKGLPQVPFEEPVNREVGAPNREHGRVDERLSSSVDRIALTRAMQELPVGYRTIFLMHEVNGYEHHEIARFLSCSVGNSKSQLHKAKARMRDLLGFTRPRVGTRTVRAKAQPLENVQTVESVGVTIEPQGWGSAARVA